MSKLLRFKEQYSKAPKNFEVPQKYINVTVLSYFFVVVLLPPTHSPAGCGLSGGVGVGANKDDIKKARASSNLIPLG
jgi:hypothetical protein